MPNTIVPCIWLDSQAEEAATFYADLFPGAQITATSRYPASSDNPSGKARGSVLTIEIELAGQRFTLLNGGPIFRPNPSVSFFVEVRSASEADRLAERLGQGGGEPLMPMGSYPWSERYGWLKDRFGVTWQIMTHRETVATRIVPCLMFAGPVHGRAEEAIQRYVEVFPGGKVLGIQHYEKGEGPEGTVKHGRFTIAGHEMVAMDSHVSHGITFDEGLSLQVMCKDQKELDRLWAELTNGGAESQCGWLKDRFGLSWQVVPSGIAAWMSSPDEGAKDRAFGAVMKMVKLDIGAIERAFKGG